MSNITVVMEFLLLRFSDNREFQILHSVSFLVLYLVALMGNSLIIALIAVECHLHKPMYFFLLNLSLADIGLVSITLPKSMFNSIFNTRRIAYSGCVSQVFFLIFFMATDFALLTVMAYDRYVAICDPLHYEAVMSKEACIQMAAITWIVALLYATLHTIGTFTMPFCSNVIDQFFCEIPQLLKISCSDRHPIEMGVHALGALLSFTSFLFIISSYVQIFRAVLRIPSMKGRKKTFSTCTPHFLVVSLFLLTTSFSYLKPNTNLSTDLNLTAAVVYSVVPPLMNPVIYSLRNQPIKMAMRKCIHLHWPLFHNL
ncbi:olfactory receptor 14A16-like [Tiliqua scincoides]|uniref:olfactory receptor 14A16-like n=1 Tax=Tiliqua scincoides TaxID=71010 RepID=UPI0034628FD6